MQNQDINGPKRVIKIPVFYVGLLWLRDASFGFTGLRHKRGTEWRIWMLPKTTCWDIIKEDVHSAVLSFSCGSAIRQISSQKLFAKRLIVLSLRKFPRFCYASQLWDFVKKTAIGIYQPLTRPLE